MNTQIVAVIIAEGAKLAGQLFRNRPIQLKPAPQPTPQPGPPASPKQEITVTPNANPPVSTVEATPVSTIEATEVATGCVPCAIGHFGTCSGLLNEAMRFAHSDGMESNEVIDRIGKCLDELNTMERVDLRPEMLVSLPDWERELADQALIASRETRHALESFESVNALERAAARTQTVRTQVWRSWIKSKMKHLTPQEKARIQEKVLEKFDELQQEGEGEEEEVAVG